jgi:hypothetical protein
MSSTRLPGNTPTVLSSQNATQRSVSARESQRAHERTLATVLYCTAKCAALWVAEAEAEAGGCKGPALLSPAGME